METLKNGGTLNYMKRAAGFAKYNRSSQMNMHEVMITFLLIYYFKIMQTE